MEIHKLKDMKGGWFVGDFTPTAYNTKDFELCYKEHTKGEQWDTHYHKEGTEINLLLEGKMIIQNTELNSGDIFILHPYEIADPIFLEDCKVVILKTPSVPGDKFVVKDE
jgi:quercetin dioxygenase-like cupin family protein